ncbi:hypothetical protein AZZ63_000970, partial [Enterobacter hormaechei]
DEEGYQLHHLCYFNMNFIINNKGMVCSFD